MKDNYFKKVLKLNLKAVLNAKWVSKNNPLNTFINVNGSYDWTEFDARNNKTIRYRLYEIINNDVIIKIRQENIFVNLSSSGRVTYIRGEFSNRRSRRTVVNGSWTIQPTIPKSIFITLVLYPSN